MKPILTPRDGHVHQVPLEMITQLNQHRFQFAEDLERKGNLEYATLLRDDREWNAQLYNPDSELWDGLRKRCS